MQMRFALLASLTTSQFVALVPHECTWQLGHRTMRWVGGLDPAVSCMCLTRQHFWQPGVHVFFDLVALLVGVGFVCAGAW